MGKTYDAITDRQRKWIAKQKVFFVATAPSGSDGHVNVSPKGLDTFQVIDDNTMKQVQTQVSNTSSKEPLHPVRQC